MSSVSSSSSGSNSPPKPPGWNTWSHKKQQDYKKKQKAKADEEKKQASKQSADDEADSLLWSGFEKEGKVDQLDEGWTLWWKTKATFDEFCRLPQDITEGMYELLRVGACIKSRFKSCGYKGIYSFPMGNALSPPYRVHCRRDEEGKRIIIVWSGDHDMSDLIKSTQYQ